MKEILFRGKEKNGEWKYGYILNDQNTRLGYYIDGYNFDIEKVVSETIGQYTGLTDKKGNRIFEDDIIKLNNKIGKVIWGGIGRYICVDKDGFEVGIEPYEYLYCEVIGNIHNNPELLGEERDDE